MTEEMMKQFDDEQMFEIRMGLKNGLTEEQVSLYARTEFDAAQMAQIRMGLKEGLTKEQIALYAKPEFDCAQMSEIRIALFNKKADAIEMTDDGLIVEPLPVISEDDFDAAIDEFLDAPEISAVDKEIEENVKDILDDDATIRNLTHFGEKVRQMFRAHKKERSEVEESFRNVDNAIDETLQDIDYLSDPNSLIPLAEIPENVKAALAQMYPGLNEADAYAQYCEAVSGKYSENKFLAFLANSRNAVSQLKCSAAEAAVSLGMQADAINDIVYSMAVAAKQRDVGGVVRLGPVLTGAIKTYHSLAETTLGFLQKNIVRPLKNLRAHLVFGLTFNRGEESNGGWHAGNKEKLNRMSRINGFASMTWEEYRTLDDKMKELFRGTAAKYSSRFKEEGRLSKMEKRARILEGNFANIATEEKFKELQKECKAVYEDFCAKTTVTHRDGTKEQLAITYDMHEVTNGRTPEDRIAKIKNGFDKAITEIKDIIPSLQRFVTEIKFKGVAAIANVAQKVYHNVLEDNQEQLRLARTELEATKAEVSLAQNLCRRALSLGTDGPEGVSTAIAKRNLLDALEAYSKADAEYQKLVEKHSSLMEKAGKRTGAVNSRRDALKAKIDTIVEKITAQKSALDERIDNRNKTADAWKKFNGR